MENENKVQATPPPIKPMKKKHGIIGKVLCILGLLVVGLGIIGAFCEEEEESGGGDNGNWNLAGQYFYSVFRESTEDEGVAYYNPDASSLKVLQATKAGCLVECTERGYDRTIWVETQKRYEDGQRLGKGYYERRGLFEYETALGAERTVARYVDVTDKGIKQEEKAKKAVLAQLETAETRSPGDTVAITLPGGATMEMVWCPPGTFTMGNLDGRYDEKPPHQVTLTKGFWMGKTEVTQAQWKSVMGYNPSRFQGDELPVETVSWNIVQLFCTKAGLELPTEAQWEYACRAGSTGPYAGTGKLDEMGWYGDNSGGEAHPVGTKLPNAWGLYDMHGSVWEWCADWYGDYPNGAVTDPQGSSSGSNRVLRGGGWNYHASYCTSSYRNDCVPSYANHGIGFRLVSTLSN